MEINITESKRYDSCDWTYHYFEMTCGKQNLQITVSNHTLCKRINVVSCNASHKAWGGLGRAYSTLNEALDTTNKGYKNEKVRRMVALACETASDLLNA